MIMLSGDTSDELEVNLERKTKALGLFLNGVETSEKVLFQWES